LLCEGLCCFPTIKDTCFAHNLAATLFLTLFCVCDGYVSCGPMARSCVRWCASNQTHEVRFYIILIFESFRFLFIYLRQKVVSLFIEGQKFMFWLRISWYMFFFLFHKRSFNQIKCKLIVWSNALFFRNQTHPTRQNQKKKNF